MKRMKILIVCCQHGGERFGALVGFELLKRGYPVEIGNPRAFIKGTRFFDTNTKDTMFLSEGGKYDAARFKQLVETCNSYDLVIDLHTTHSKVGEVAIIGENNEELISAVASLGVKKLAIMPREVFKNALGGHIDAKIISLEYGVDYEQTEESATKLAERIAGVGSTRQAGQVEVFHIAGTIKQKYRKARLRNYIYSAAIDGIPFLVGETSYKTHAGFFADRCETVIIGGDDE